MKLGIFVATFMVAFTTTFGFNWSRNPRDWHIVMRGAMNKLKHKASHNATFRAMLEDHFKAFDLEPEIKLIDYQCDLPKSPSPPTSAHAVRPGDLNVIASIGDSITAGYGITAVAVADVLLNDRHYSWITGGTQSLDRGVISVNNILRKFNAGITGYSFDESYAEDREAGLNVAVGGAIAEDTPGQAEFLVQKMQDPAYGVDFENDWKLINFMIGTNDLCRYCWDPDYFSPENFVGHIQQALDILYERVPKAIVVLTNIFDISPLAEFSTSLICDLVQLVACSCIEDVEVSKEAQMQYVQKVQELIASGRYDCGRDDFTVVYMNHFDKSQPPRIPETGQVDRSFWSPDCFHPGMKAHYAYATSTWNQLFEPVGEKREEHDWQLGTNLVCPTEADPYIKTNLNSQRKDEYTKQ